mgnify:CR=1 FL=1
MITLKQRGRAGLQFLGSLQTFSSSTLRDIAEQDYAAQPEAPELAEEFKSDARPHVWQDRLRRARDVVERSKAYRFNRFYQRWVGEQNYIRAIPAVEARRTEWQAIADAKKPKDTSRLQLNPNLEIPSWYEGVEWHLEFFARLKCENIFVFFQRNNPPVDQCLGRICLTAKVVYDKDAAGGLKLQRGLIGSCSWVVDQIEHVERQFTTRDHGWTFATHIACIKTARCPAQAVGIVDVIFGCRMHNWIVDSDNLTRKFDGARHIDFVAKRVTNSV